MHIIRNCVCESRESSAPFHSYEDFFGSQEQEMGMGNGRGTGGNYVGCVTVIFTCSIRLIDHRLHNSSSRIDEPAKGKRREKDLVFDSRFSVSVSISNLIKLVEPSCCIIYNYFI